MSETHAGENPKTVLLWGRDDAFGWSIDYLLRGRTGWELKTIPQEDGIASLIQHVEALKPCAVLIYGEDCDFVAELMKCFPELKVISASLEDSTIEVYTKDSVNLEGVADLLASIEAEPIRREPGKGAEQGVE